MVACFPPDPFQGAIRFLELTIPNLFCQSHREHHGYFYLPICTIPTTRGAPSPRISTTSYDQDLRPIGTTTTWQSNGTTLFKDQVTYDPVCNMLSRMATEAASPGKVAPAADSMDFVCGIR